MIAYLTTATYRQSVFVSAGAEAKSSPRTSTIIEQRAIAISPSDVLR